MNPPNKRCMDAVELLTEHHRKDSAAYYCLDGETAVIVVTDGPTIAMLMHLLSMTLGEEDFSVENVDDALATLLTPDKPIEA